MLTVRAHDHRGNDRDFVHGAGRATRFSMVGRRSVWGALAALAVGIVACAAPTLPLPPPAAPTVESLGNGEYRLRGERSVDPYAIVVLYNQNYTRSFDERTEATQADAEGTWETRIKASPRDLIDIWQESGATKSPPSTIQIPR